MNRELLRGAAQIAAWGVAFAWGVKTTDALQNLPSLPNLTGMEWDVMPEGTPSLTVVVPAKDEAAKVAATLETLVQQDYPNLQVVAVNDRSSDETGAILNRYAKLHPMKITVLHIKRLPDGWLGKTHALAQALKISKLRANKSEYVLFTDADVLFSPSILRRSLAYAVAEGADHLVTMPTMQVKSHGEGILLGFFQIFGLWASRPWRVADPDAQRDVIGVGAFNLLRREALGEIGGLEPQRLVVLEDITLARRTKAAGLRQRIAFAPGLVLVHWAAGVRGLLHVMSKNLFSAFNFRPSLVLLACAWVGVFCLAPFAGLAWWATLLPTISVLACVAAAYRMYGERSWISPKYGWAFPVGAILFCCALLRSMLMVWKDRGVRWRGTLYPLRELRRHNSPWQWQRVKSFPKGRQS